MARRKSLQEDVQTATEKTRRTRSVKKGLSKKIDHLHLCDVTPMNKKQQLFMDKFNEGYNILANGSAGSGKGYISLYLAFKDIITDKFEKIIIIRSAVSGRPQGFIPGDINQKEEIYSWPYKFLINKLFESGTAYDELLKKRIIEFTTTSYLRGLTFDDSIILFDEFQNASKEEIETVLTRLGERSKIIFNGDIRQSDFYRTREVSGFNWLIDVIRHKNMEKYFYPIEFTFNDCVRSGLVKDILMTINDIEKHK